MDILANLGQGFAVAAQPINLFYALLGCIMGTIIGVLPGIGPVTGIALLLPLTFGRDPASAMIMLAGIYYGAMYGGSTTSVLANIPGESSSVMTAIEGYQLAKKGRAGATLGLAAIASWIAGTLSILGLMLFAPPLANLAIKFAPPEYFAVMLAAFSLVAGLTGGSVVKGLISVIVGLLLATVGVDVISGDNRFTMNLPQLYDGVEFLVVAIGVFAVAEILENVEKMNMPMPQFQKMGLREMLPNREEARRSLAPILRATGLGFIVGVLPGAGATIASFLSYGLEKSLSKHPEEFGHGAIEGVAGPEAANNAASGGAMVPLLTLGIPGSGSTAIMLGALMMMNITPGPLLFAQHPDVVWGLIASMYIGNVMLLVLNLPLIGLFVQVLRLPYSLLCTGILVLSVVGVYAMNNNLFDTWLMLIFGVVGYFMKRFNYPLPPLVLALVLGRMTEKALRQSLLLSDGSWSIFFTRPLPAIIITAMAAAALWKMFKLVRGGTTISA